MNVIELQYGETKKMALYNDLISQDFYLPSFTSPAITLQSLVRVNDFANFICPSIGKLNSKVAGLGELNAPTEHAYKIINAHVFIETGKVFPFEESPGREYVRDLVQLYDPENTNSLLKFKNDLNREDFIIFKGHGKEFAASLKKTSHQKKYTAIFNKYMKCANIFANQVILTQEFHQKKNGFNVMIEKFKNKLSPEELELIKKEPAYLICEGLIGKEQLVQYLLPQNLVQNYKDYLEIKTPAQEITALINYRFQVGIIDSSQQQNLQEKLKLCDTEKKQQDLKHEVLSLTRKDQNFSLKQTKNQDTQSVVQMHGDAVHGGDNFQEESVDFQEDPFGFKEKDDSMNVEFEEENQQENEAGKQFSNKQKSYFEPDSMEEVEVEIKQPDNMEENFRGDDFEGINQQMLQMMAYYNVVNRDKTLEEVKRSYESFLVLGKMPEDLLLRDLQKFNITPTPEAVKIFKDKKEASLINGVYLVDDIDYQPTREDLEASKAQIGAQNISPGRGLQANVQSSSLQKSPNQPNSSGMQIESGGNELKTGSSPQRKPISSFEDKK